MPMPVPYNKSDAMTGNGMKKDKKAMKGKGKNDLKALKGDDVFAMFGDDKSKFAQEPLLPSPNSAGRGPAGF